MENGLMRLPAVLELVGLKKSALYNLIRAGQFPRPVQLTGRSVAWRKREVLAWNEARPQKAAANQ